MQPTLQIRSGPFRPRASQLAAAVDWLVTHGVPQTRVADAFQLKAGNVRTIRSRFKRASRQLQSPSELLGSFEDAITEEPYIRIPSKEVQRAVGISSGHDYVVLTHIKERELDSMAKQVEATWLRYAAASTFPGGVAEMSAYIPRLGFPRSTRRIRILALLRQHIAWFFVHNGQARSALDQSRRAVALWLKAYSETRDRSDLAQVSESALIASMARQLCNQPEHSTRLLALAKAAREASGQPESPEHLRQLGVVHLQLGQDDEARKCLKAAMERMRETGDTPVATVEMMGGRQMNLLGSTDWEGARSLFDGASAIFPAGTLQYSINANWAAAVSIATGNAQAIQDGLNLLEKAEATSLRFGHQATIHHLLSATPRLKLPPKLLQPWLRFALYYDAFSDD